MKTEPGTPAHQTPSSSSARLFCPRQLPGALRTPAWLSTPPWDGTRESQHGEGVPHSDAGAFWNAFARHRTLGHWETSSALWLYLRSLFYEHGLNRRMSVPHTPPPPAALSPPKIRTAT